MKRLLATPRFLAALTVLAGFGLRVFRLGYQELRGDETFGYFFSLNDLGRIASATLELREPHPLASYWLQHVWMRVAGGSEFALRFTSLWFGTLSIALIYTLARQVGLRGKGPVLAAAFLALSPYALWHSQDARMYSMSLALTLASSTLALGFLRRPRRSTGAAYVLVSLLALHTHYFAAFVIVAQNLWFLWRLLPRSPLPAIGGQRMDRDTGRAPRPVLALADRRPRHARQLPGQRRLAGLAGRAAKNGAGAHGR